MRTRKVKTTQAVIDNAIADAYNSGFTAGRLDSGLEQGFRIQLAAILRQQPDQQIAIPLADMLLDKGNIIMWEDLDNRHYQLKEE